MRNIRTIEVYLNDNTLKDIIAAHLYATSTVHDNEEVLEVVLGEPNAENIRPIQFKVIENREIELIIHS